MNQIFGLLAGAMLLLSSVGCCCKHLCCGHDMCAPACPPPCAPACPTCPTCPPGGGYGTYGADPFSSPPVVQPQGYYGTMNAPITGPPVAVGPAVPQTTMLNTLPTY